MILERIGILRSMRKRRVGVTARSRQNDGNQATGALQFVTEMAAPLELRTPAGTCGGSCNQSADGSMATMARREVNGQKSNPSRACEGTEMALGDGALEALPQTPPGGKPPETPSPLSLGIQVPERREFVKGSQAAQQRRALDKFPPF